MKITFIVPSLAPKGPTFQLFNLIEDMQVENELQICVLSNVHAETSKKLSEMNIRAIYLPVKGILSFFVAYKKIIESGSDIYHSHGVKADLMNAFVRNSSSASIATIRNIPWKDYPARWKLFGWLVCIFHCLILMRLVTVACSTWMLKPLKFLNCKYAINNATNNFYNLERQENFNGRFFYVGSLSKRKNVQRCLEILEGLVSASSLDLYGAGNEHLKSERIIINKKGHCLKNEINATNKIFISMSNSEGLPNSVLEALNTGCYCILSDIPAHRVIKELFPRYVHIYESIDALETWLVSIETELNYESQKMRAILNLQLNTTKHMADRYVEIYKNHKI